LVPGAIMMADASFLQNARLMRLCFASIAYYETTSSRFT